MIGAAGQTRTDTHGLNGAMKPKGRDPYCASTNSATADQGIITQSLFRSQDFCVVAVDHDYFEQIEKVFKAVNGLEFVESGAIA